MTVGSRGSREASEATAAKIQLSGDGGVLLLAAGEEVGSRALGMYFPSRAKDSLRDCRG